jgi:hypothetical protein
VNNNEPKINKRHFEEKNGDCAACLKYSVPINVTGKAIPLQAWTGPEGSRSLRIPYFKTIGT